jgi:hypothetical protein
MKSKLKLFTIILLSLTILQIRNVVAQVELTPDGDVIVGTGESQTLKINGTLQLNGATSGQVQLKVPAESGSAVLVLPATNGASGQVLATDGNGILQWQSPVGGLPGQTGYNGAVLTSVS